MDPIKWLRDEVQAWSGTLGAKRITLTLSYLRELSAEIARLTAERDAAIARAERAERVAVWAVIHGVVFTNSMIGGPHLMIDGCRIRVEDTDDAVFRALVEAMKGG